MKQSLYIIVAIYGLFIGSFLNVCIIRIPKGESLAFVRSHCVHCGYQIRWYDLIPVFSYVFLKGRCRSCHNKISIQYPVIEALNSVLYLVVFLVNGFNLPSVLFCLITSALIVLSVIDERTYEIPVGINLFILLIGFVRVALDFPNWPGYVIGFCMSSGILLFIYVITSGNGIGGGDIKLMAAAGLVLGWKLILLALGVGAILGSVIHIARMKLSDVNHMLAFGPYLSMGIFLSMIFGEHFLLWYSRLLIG